MMYRYYQVLRRQKSSNRTTREQAKETAGEQPIGPSRVCRHCFLALHVLLNSHPIHGIGKLASRLDSEVMSPGFVCALLFGILFVTLASRTWLWKQCLRLDVGRKTTET